MNGEALPPTDLELAAREPTSAIHAAAPSGPSPSAFEARLAAALHPLAQGDAAAAEEGLRALLRDVPATAAGARAQIQSRLADMLLGRGDAERAYAHADEAAFLSPADVQAICLRGMALAALGRRVEAEAAYRVALGRAPGSVMVHHRLGTLLADLGRHGEAILAFRTALDVDPDFCPARRALSEALRDEGRFAEALEELDRVIAVEGETPALGTDRGILHLQLRKPRAAIAAFDRALAQDPEYAPARVNCALALLLSGDYQRGWSEYEWRFKTAECRPIRFARPRWQGEPVKGKTVVLWAEQGHGDTIQFVRYAPLIAAHGAHVVLMVQPGLVRLLRALPGIGEVVPIGAAVGHHDFHVPIMSLPALFGSDLRTLPAEVPYLAVDPQARARLAGAMPAPTGRKRVGLVWAGAPRPDQPTLSAADRRRSVALASLAPLFDVDGIDFVSLQTGRAAAEAARAPFAARIHDPMGAVVDFADTAALIEQLDLVVTVDTAVAHLAGALGKPVWVLSRHDGCWRWLDGRDDSPWYPTLRLFRQRAPGDWTHPIAAVTAALDQFSRKVTARPTAAPDDKRLEA